MAQARQHDRYPQHRGGPSERKLEHVELGVQAPISHHLDVVVRFMFLVQQLLDRVPDCSWCFGDVGDVAVHEKAPASATRLECQSSCARNCNSAGWSMLPWKTAPAYASGLLKKSQARTCGAKQRQRRPRSCRKPQGKGNAAPHHTRDWKNTPPCTKGPATKSRFRTSPCQGRLERIFRIPTCDVPRKGNRKPGCETSCCGHGRPQLCRTAR